MGVGEESVQDIQLAVVSSVGKAIDWPQFSVTLEENRHEKDGSRIQITGADRASIVRWLRSAADLIEKGKYLKVTGF